jgi:Arc/MetJ-type ribon-helix-helix transcriptional regulator
MKVSISIPEGDLHFIDEYAERRDIASRSAVVHEAIELLRLRELEDSYADAWQEWESSDDAGLWDATSADGMADAAR